MRVQVYAFWRMLFFVEDYACFKVGHRFSSRFSDASLSYYKARSVIKSCNVLTICSKSWDFANAHF